MKHFESVQDLVEQVENQYGIKALSIRDYGSRAWSLDSEDSDIDAAMVFKQNPTEYAKVDSYTESIDRKFVVEGEEFELMGWNIKRFGELLYKSNPSILEWLNSNISYYELSPYWMLEGEKIYEPTDEQLKDPRLTRVNTVNVSKNLEKIRVHANKEFKPISLIYHYRSMAKSNYRKYIENNNDPTVKRYLYVLRGLTYARYIERTHSMPPLNFPEFYDRHLTAVPQRVNRYIGSFIQAKKNGNGARTIIDNKLSNWIGEELNRQPDNEEHNVRGIKKQRVNKFIEEVV